MTSRGASEGNLGSFGGVVGVTAVVVVLVVVVFVGCYVGCGLLCGDSEGQLRRAGGDKKPLVTPQWL
jgi:hypothetical protein